MFSQMDRDSIGSDPDTWIKHGYRVGLGLTIAALSRASSRDHCWLDDGAIEFTLGNYRLWLKGYTCLSEGGAQGCTKDNDPDGTEPRSFGRAEPCGRGLNGALC